MSFLIRVPATTANLGPGFDCLGLALDLWNEVEVSENGHELSIELTGDCADRPPLNADNAIYQALCRYASRHQRELPAGLTLKCTNRIPFGSGLGSSSAAVVAGILAAAAILQLPQDTEDQLDCATQLEGHPDNVAPCLYGGLVASAKMDDKVLALRLTVADFALVIVHPFFTFPTRVARAALPKQVPHADAVFNASRVIFEAEALRSGDPHLLRAALQDRLHEPYRLPLIPGASQAIAAAQTAGAISTVLSGAGPSLLAFCPDPSAAPAIAEAIQTAFAQAGLKSEVFFPTISQNGAYCTNL
jgi:homoserine kinase